jgi:hypothetical protein
MKKRSYFSSKYGRSDYGKRQSKLEAIAPLSGASQGKSMVLE